MPEDSTQDKGKENNRSGLNNNKNRFSILPKGRQLKSVIKLWEGCWDSEKSNRLGILRIRNKPQEYHRLVRETKPIRQSSILLRKILRYHVKEQRRIGRIMHSDIDIFGWIACQNGQSLSLSECAQLSWEMLENSGEYYIKAWAKGSGVVWNKRGGAPGINEVSIWSACSSNVR